MTPQSSFMVLAPVDPAARSRAARGCSRLDERRARARERRQRADPVRAVRQAALRALAHRGRQDARRHSRLRAARRAPIRSIWRSSAMSTATRTPSWRSWRGAQRPGLRAMFSCCEGFTPDDRSRCAWMKRAQRAGRCELRELAGTHRAPGPRRRRVARRARASHPRARRPHSTGAAVRRGSRTLRQLVSARTSPPAGSRCRRRSRRRSAGGSAICCI